MTEQEAIKELERHIQYLRETWKPYPDPDVIEALGMAIYALEKQTEKKAPIRCLTCARYTDTAEIDNTCYLCCKGIEDNYKQKEEQDMEKYCNNCDYRLIGCCTCFESDYYAEHRNSDETCEHWKQKGE